MENVLLLKENVYQLFSIIRSWRWSITRLY